MMNLKSILALVLLILIAGRAQSDTFRSLVIQPTSLTLKSDSLSIVMKLYSPTILRIDYLPTGVTQPDSSFSVIRQEGPAGFRVQETDSTVTIGVAAFVINCLKNPLSLSFNDAPGSFQLKESTMGGFRASGGEQSIRYQLDAGTHFYGTGERGTSLDKRGQRFESYNTQIGGYNNPLPTMNLNVPFICTLSGYALFFDNTYKGIFDLGATEPTEFSYTATGGNLSVYLIRGATIPDQLEQYTWLTGRQPLPPRWAFGYIHSKNRYLTEEETRGIAATMREKQFPLEALVLDLAWFEHMGDLSWDIKSWPAHEAMQRDFLADGIKTILITEPYLVDLSKNFKIAEERGFLASDSTGKPVLLPRWWSCRGCSAALLDMTNAAAREWWWSLHPPSFGTLTAGIWTDLGEPERHPETMIHHLGPAYKIHNIYNLLWAETIFNGFNRDYPNQRILNLTRSGFAGIQRYGVIPWSGDVGRGFGGLEVQLPMLLNMGMSGLAYHNSDIGGYARQSTSPELYIRWMQYGVFSPITRVHGAGENVGGAPTEPWMFGEEAESISRQFLQLRQQLIPYIYNLAVRNYRTGFPICRPLFFLDPTDTSLTNLGDSFLFGDAFLVSPVTRAGQREKQVYLPAGQWVNFWTDEMVQGQQTVTVQAPLSQIPVFVRTGSIVPASTPMRYSDERPLDTLRLWIYPEKESLSEYTLYEDDGKTLNYQKGEFAETTIIQRNYLESGIHRFEIHTSRPTGASSLLPEQRIFLFEIHGLSFKPGKFLNSGKELKKFHSLEDLKKSKDGCWVNPIGKQVFVQISENSENAISLIITE